MLYEGVPIKKKPAQEVTPAHPAPVHEKVFGREQTRATLEAVAKQEEKAFLEKPATLDDKVFGKEVRTKEAQEKTREKIEAYDRAFLDKDLVNLEDREAYEEALVAIKENVMKLSQRFRINPYDSQRLLDSAAQLANGAPRSAKENPEVFVKISAEYVWADELEDRRKRLEHFERKHEMYFRRLIQEKVFTEKFLKQTIVATLKEYKEAYLPLASYLEVDKKNNLPEMEDLELVAQDEKLLQDYHQSWMKRFGLTQENSTKAA